MAQAKDLQRLVEGLRGRSENVLSVYLNADPGLSKNQGNAHLIRLKNALREQEVPEEIANPVYEAVESGPPRARTLVFFADGENLFEQYNMQVDLPESFNYGEPYLAPMALALESYETYAAALVDAEEVRLFVTELAETPGEATASHDPDRPGYREVEITSSTPGMRGKTEDESQSNRSSQHMREFYNQAGQAVRHAAFERGARHLILAGPHERTSEFHKHLPQEIQNRVLAEEPVSVDAPDGEILERIDYAKQRAETERKADLLERARENGIGGAKDTLDAMNEGRIYHLLVLWELAGEVRWCDNDRLVITDITASECPFCGQGTSVRPLIETLVDLASEMGARIEFMRPEDEMAQTMQEDIRAEGGGPGETVVALRDEFDGIAGLLRF